MSSRDEKLIDTLAQKISESFKLKSLGCVNQFIGINVERSVDGVYKINQSTYIKKIAETFGLQDAKGSTFPMDPGYFSLDDDEFLESNSDFRKVIGMLLYVATNTRPDISATVGILSQRLSKPRKLDLTESFRVIKYLLKTIDISLILDAKSQTPLRAYTDANWGENRTDRKSTTGYICQVFSSTISWSSRRQSVVATSTTESEFYALAETVKEIKWLKSLLNDFDIFIEQPIPIHIDSQSCMKMVENEKFSNRTKHIDVRYHFVKDELEKQTISLTYEPSETNIADMLTKPLRSTKISQLREIANIN
jgi:hypothetical protein